MDFDSDAIQKVFQDSDKWLMSPQVLVREYSFYFQKPEIKITVWIYLEFENTTDRRYRFELSHYIRTPEQAGTYLPSAPYRPTEASALEAAIRRTLLDFYNSAVKAGHEPSLSWFVGDDT